MDTPKISVIIPVYNLEKYLSECLDSCLTQDFSDAEFICVNDGSTDQSLAILEEYRSKDQRVRVISKTNGGLSSARNAGLKEALGSWVMFLDGDDKLKDNALLTLYEHILKDPAEKTDVIIFCADTFPVDINTENWYKKTLQFPAASYSSFDTDVLFKERGAMPFVWRQAYRREFITKSKVCFDETLMYGEDVQFQMEIFPHGRGFEFITDVLLSYRLNRSGSMMDGVVNDSLKTVDRHMEMIRHIADYWKEQGWLEEYGAQFLGWILKFTILKVKALNKDLRRKKASYMFDEIIAGYDLERFKNSLPLKDRALYGVYSAMRKI